MRDDAPTVVPIAPLNLNRHDAAGFVGVSLRSWDALTSSGKNPAPFRLAGRVLWRVADLRAWAAAGFPGRAGFEAAQCDGSRGL